MIHAHQHLHKLEINDLSVDTYRVCRHGSRRTRIEVNNSRTEPSQCCKEAVGSIDLSTTPVRVLCCKCMDKEKVRGAKF